MVEDWRTDHAIVVQQVRDVSSVPSLFPLVSAPRMPGVEALDAYIHNGAVLLRELYHMACSSAQIAPTPGVPFNNSGGPLAYSVFLGSAIDFGWERNSFLPGNDPTRVIDLYFRALAAQHANARVASVVRKVCSQILLKADESSVLMDLCNVVCSDRPTNLITHATNDEFDGGYHQSTSTEPQSSSKESSLCKCSSRAITWLLCGLAPCT